MKNIMFLESLKPMPLMTLPVRSVVVKTKDSRILFSPGSMLTEAQLKSAGDITDLVAPNEYHTAGISMAKKIFSHAKTWGPRNYFARHKDKEFVFEITNETWPYADEISAVLLQGMPKVNEWVFFHKESKSLIVTDLCFNMVDTIGLGAWIIQSLFGTYRRFAVSKFFARFITDKNAFEKSLSNVFNFDFENIIVSHGNNIIGNAKPLLKQALGERSLLVRKEL